MENEKLYHLVEKVVWEACLEFKEPYFPASFEKVGCPLLRYNPGPSVKEEGKLNPVA
jgi:hypothetical protein